MHTIKSIKEVNDNTIKKYELIYHASLPYLKTNLKNMDIILEILKEKYSIEEFNDKNFLLNIEKETNEKYGKVGNSNILGFKINKDDCSKELFSKNEDNMENIYFGINLDNNGFYVDGSTSLYNKLICLRGLSKEELDNIWLTCEYIMVCNG